MSDDGYARYRKNESHGRGGASGPSSHGEDDPLAELARLIGQDQPAPPPDWRASPASYDDDYPYAGEQQADSRYEDRGYSAEAPYGAEASQNQFNAYGDKRFPGYGETGQSGQRTGQQAGQRYEDPRYFEDQNSEDEDFEDEPPPPPRSRGGAASFVVVLGLAALGTAGAFAYRSLFHGSGDSPPVILADAAPNKILPNSQSSDGTGQADSAPPDRQAERMVSREESPLSVQNAPNGAQLPMASTTPPLLAPAPQAQQAPQAQLAGPPASQTSPSGEPRRVHTVTIRPDQQRVASSNAAFPTGSTGARNPNQPDGDATAPLSLSPQGSPPESVPPHSKLASTASRPVQPPTAPAPPPVSAPPVAAAGSFFVQVSAQKSEEDAQTAFRAMQAKYPDQLGGRQPVIRRKDLEKGVFFGVQVGPFASRDDAVQLCESLKSAGGACMIQKN
jgi:hypothetical protein